MEGRKGRGGGRSREGVYHRDGYKLFDTCDDMKYYFDSIKI